MKYTSKDDREKILLNLIKYPIITDKTTKLIEENQYCFAVQKKASKPIIKESIEYIFKVKVRSINTCNQPTKKRRVGRFSGKKANYKKAIVTLYPENRINLFPEN